MTRWIAGLICAALATCSPVHADVSTYSGALHGTVAGATVAASVEIQIDGTPAIGQTVKARARLTSDPGPYPVSRDWSRWYTAAISGQPFRANVDLPDLRGRLGVDWTTNSLTVAAEGTAGVFALTVPPQRLALAFSSLTPTNTAPQPERPASAILTRVYKAGSDIGWDGEVPSSWPRKTGSNGKTVNAITALNGKKFDCAGVGQHRKTLANLYGAEYGQPIQRGQTVYFSLMDLNKRNETPRLPIVWEWEPTGR